MFYYEKNNAPKTNYTSQYAKQKGFCEDLDEGKYSLPLIHSLQTEPQNRQLQSILIQRRVAGKSALGHKILVLEHLQRTKSLEYTAEVLITLHDEIMRQIDGVEKTSRMANFPLRLLLDMLRVEKHAEMKKN